MNKLNPNIKQFENCIGHFQKFIAKDFDDFCKGNKIDATTDNLIKYCIQFNLFKDATLRQYTAVKLYHKGYYENDKVADLLADIDATIQFSHRNTQKEARRKRFISRNEVNLFDL